MDEAVCRCWAMESATSFRAAILSLLLVARYVVNGGTSASESPSSPSSRSFPSAPSSSFTIFLSWKADKSSPLAVIISDWDFLLGVLSVSAGSGGVRVVEFERGLGGGMFVDARIDEGVEVVDVLKKEGVSGEKEEERARFALSVEKKAKSG